jgi:hypothetical protein
MASKSWPHLFRAPSRRSRVARRESDEGSSFVEIPHRHPAMIGLNISPVHGHHCICDRCAPRARSHS